MKMSRSLATHVKCVKKMMFAAFYHFSRSSSLRLA